MLRITERLTAASYSALHSALHASGFGLRSIVLIPRIKFVFIAACCKHKQLLLVVCFVSLAELSNASGGSETTKSSWGCCSFTWVCVCVCMCVCVCVWHPSGCAFSTSECHFSLYPYDIRFIILHFSICFPYLFVARIVLCASSPSLSLFSGPLADQPYPLQYALYMT